MSNSRRTCLQKGGYKFRFIASVAATVVVTLVMAGCGGSKVDEEMVRPANMGPADIHKVQSEELERVMRTMKVAVYEREATALDIDEERLRQAEMIAGILVLISKEIVDLEKRDLQSDMTTENRETFLRYAGEIGMHGERFKEIAAGGQAEAFMPAVRQMVQTCNACHDRFRDM